MVAFLCQSGDAAAAAVASRGGSAAAVRRKVSSHRPRSAGRSPRCVFGGLAATAAVSVLALLLRPAEAAQSQAFGSLKAKAAASAASQAQAEMIPEWRVDALLQPSQTLDALAAAKRAADREANKPEEEGADNRSAAPQAPTNGSTDAYLSTIAQDQQKCPMVKLTSDLILYPEYVTLWGQNGKWTSKPSMVSLGSWRQNFFAQAWTKVNFWDADGRTAVKAQEMTEDELAQSFGWKAGAPAWSYGNISSLVANWEEAMYRTRLRAQNQPSRRNFARTTQMAVPSPFWQHVALTDCSGELLFVVRLNETTTMFPGGVSVYDRAGTLVATSLTNSLLAYHQFIDTQGFVLATAQAPELNSTLPFEYLPKDASRGGMLTYHLKFAEGNYVGASRLLDQDFRWVLAAAVQLRALQDARSVWSPWLPQALPVLYWVVAGLLAFLAAAACLFVYRPFRAAAPKYVGEGWPGRMGTPWKLPERSL